MIKKLIALATILSSLLIVSSPALAYNPYSGLGNSCKSAPTSAVCTDSPNTSNPISGKDGILYRATLVVAFVAGVAAVILIIIASIKFITSGGNPEKISKARSSLTNTVIGLVIISLAASIISFILSKV